MPAGPGMAILPSMGSKRWDGYQAPRRQRSAWTISAAVLATVLIAGGLVVVGMAVILLAGLSQWSSNK
jgi:hypothetical protein